MTRSDVESCATLGDAVAAVVRATERRFSDDDVAEGERVIARAHTSGYRVRSWYRAGLYTIAVPWANGEPVTLVGRGSSLTAALASLGVWEAF